VEGNHLASAEAALAANVIDSLTELRRRSESSYSVNITEFLQPTKVSLGAPSAFDWKTQCLYAAAMYHHGRYILLLPFFP
jgi:hypothetical protein